MARLSLAETAKHLGLSERTVRRHLVEGKLSGTQIMSATGPRWLIDIDDTPRDLVPVETAPRAPEVVEQILGELRAIRERLDALEPKPVLLPEATVSPWIVRVFGRFKV